MEQIMHSRRCRLKTICMVENYIYLS
ncbi:hypothetical protein Patl1_34561 [Pistacia atlantica]|uniref:Uncharacterized protein n=1 Tax=Pistacia atlantica TaxID=434234 RepID=A0ACC0ZSU7_9ROSI|nr:hypothetical protein Patl1_34561 [Pistacia atlantica]